MGTDDYESMNVEDLHDMANVDHLPTMLQQVRGWNSVVQLFTEEINSLKANTNAAKATWKGAAADRYFEEVDTTIASMEQAKEIAAGNSSAWFKIHEQAKGTREDVNTQFTAWQQAKGQLDQEKKDDEGFQLGDLGDPFGAGNNVTDEDYNEKRKPFDEAARKAARTRGETMESEYIRNLWNPETRSSYEPPPDPGKAPDWPGLGDNTGGTRSRTPGGGLPTDPGSGRPVPPPEHQAPPQLQSPPPVSPPPPTTPPPVTPPPVTPPPVTPPPFVPPPTVPPPPVGRPVPPPTTPRPPTPPVGRPTPPPVGRPTPPPQVAKPPGTVPPGKTAPPPAPRPPGRTVPPVIGSRPGTGPAGGPMGRGPMGGAPVGRGGPGAGPIANAQRPAPVVRPLNPPVIGGRPGAGPNGGTSAGVRGNPMTNPAMRPGQAGMDTRGVFGTRASKTGAGAGANAAPAANRAAGVRMPTTRTGAESGINRGVIMGAKQTGAQKGSAGAGAGLAGGKRGNRSEERTATIESDGPLDNVFNVDQTVVPSVIRGWNPETDANHTAGPTAFGERPGKVVDRRKKRADDEWDDW